MGGQQQAVGRVPTASVDEIADDLIDHSFSTGPAGVARALADGPTLFAGLSKHVDLRLVGQQELGSGVAAMRYEPGK